MFSAPNDPTVLERMNVAFGDAAARLGCAHEPEAQTVWGHGGRTIGAPVNTRSGRTWLRVLESPEGRQGGKLWIGAEQAATALPDDVPRPRLLHSTEWDRNGYAYRAELSSYVSATVCSGSPDLTEAVSLPDVWWSRLRRACDTVTKTPAPATRPPVITQDYLHRAIPTHIGDVNTGRLDTTVHRWSLAHGDLHWANLTGPKLSILDWEGFGPAPYGFDAAHLYAYTLPVPEVATRVRRTFADVLDTAEGWFAEIVVAAILLQAADRDPVHSRLAPHVRAHVARLLASSPHHGSQVRAGTRKS